MDATRRPFTQNGRWSLLSTTLALRAPSAVVLLLFCPLKLLLSGITLDGDTTQYGSD